MEKKCKKNYKLIDGKCTKKKGVFAILENIKSKKIWWIAGIIVIILAIILLIVFFNFDGLKNFFSISSDMIPAPTSGGGGG